MSGHQFRSPDDDAFWILLDAALKRGHALAEGKFMPRAIDVETRDIIDRAAKAYNETAGGSIREVIAANVARIGKGEKS